jgi:hypothetical protein
MPLTANQRDPCLPRRPLRAPSPPSTGSSAHKIFKSSSFFYLAPAVVCLHAADIPPQPSLFHLRTAPVPQAQSRPTWQSNERREECSRQSSIFCAISWTVGMPAVSRSGFTTLLRRNLVTLGRLRVRWVFQQVGSLPPSWLGSQSESPAPHSAVCNLLMMLYTDLKVGIWGRCLC